MISKKLALLGGKPIRSSFLPYGCQWLDDSDINSVCEVLRADFITQGPKIKEFEKKLAIYCNAKYAVAFSSGTAALHAAVFATGIKQGDEVITSPITFLSSSNCVIFTGGKVIFSDIKKDTYNIDQNILKNKITSKTKAILPVDYAGLPCDLNEINDIAEKNDLTVIEDASHAIGAEYHGKKIGGLSDLTIFSFHPVKHITTGEGGMVLTNNKEYHEKLLLFRSHGIVKDEIKMVKNEGSWYYEMHNLGYNYRITDFQCALGISQLKKLNRFIEIRRNIVNIYNNAFKDIKEIITPFEPNDRKSSYHLYVIKLKLKDLKVGRKEIFNALRAENIGVHVHYIPIHLQPFYQKLYNYKIGDFPISEDFYRHVITLPLFSKMNNKDIEDVIKAVRKVISFYRK